jgi:hypothetical protein
MSKRKTVPAIKLTSPVQTPPLMGTTLDLLPVARAEFEKRKLTILAKMYGLNDPLVDHDAAIKLCMRVCFPPSGKGGRPKGTTMKWSFIQGLRFVANVEKIKRKKGCSDRKAIWELMRASLGQNEATSKSAIDSLANRYYEALRTLPGSDNPGQRRVALDYLVRMKFPHD